RASTSARPRSGRHSTRPPERPGRTPANTPPRRRTGGRARERLAAASCRCLAWELCRQFGHNDGHLCRAHILSRNTVKKRSALVIAVQGSQRWRWSLAILAEGAVRRPPFVAI